MIKPILSFALLFLIGCTNYKKLHREAIVIDTHNDVISTVSMRGMNIDHDLAPQTHSDTKRFLKSGIDVQVFAIFSDERFGKDTAFKYANIEIDTLEAIVRRNGDNMRMVFTPEDLDAAVKRGMFGCMIGLEGGHMIEDKIEHLDSLFTRGVRYMTLTWNNSTSWASSAWDEVRGTGVNKGLNELGRQIVRRMNELGMIVDVSHAGEQTFWDAIRVTTKPVIASHSCAHAICPVPRNLKDDQIRAIGKNGGVIHLNFYSGFIDSNYNDRLAGFNKIHQREKDSLKSLKWVDWEIEEWLNKKYPKEAEELRPPMSMLIDHLDHIVKLTSVDHVGIGSDFDGISSSPQELDDVTDMPKLTKALLKRGYSKADVKKILGENFIRVFKEAQRISLETMSFRNSSSHVELTKNEYTLFNQGSSYTITILNPNKLKEIAKMENPEVVFSHNERRIVVRGNPLISSGVPKYADGFYSFTHQSNIIALHDENQFRILMIDKVAPPRNMNR